MQNLCIYKIENKINGKVYIGQTIRGLNHRKNQHIQRFKSCERDHKLYLAFNKYGMNNFVFEVIFCTFDKSYLNDLEIHFIKEYNSYNRGYNMTMGGDTVSVETREKLSKIFKGRKVTWMDKVLESRRNNPNKRDPKDFVPKGSDSNLSKTYEILLPNGTIEIVKGLRAFCKTKSIDHSTLLGTISGKQTHHKGYRIISKFNDYPEGEYTQVSGNGECPISL